MPITTAKIESTLTRDSLIASLSQSPHGNYNTYVPAVTPWIDQDPEFVARLIAWNYIKGQVRDSKVALPIITLSTPKFPEVFRDNSLAHLALLDPRNLIKALRYGRGLHLGSRGKLTYDLVRRYLKVREADLEWFDRTAIHFRQPHRELYALYKIAPSAYAQAILFDNDYSGAKTGMTHVGSIFQAVRDLSKMDPAQAAGAILELKIPFLVVKGCLQIGPKTINNPGTKAVLMALIERMSPTELVTSMKSLESMGVRQVPELRAALESALTRARGSRKNILKTTVAAEEVEDPAIKAKLQSLQQAQIERTKAATPAMEGDVLILVDKSGSMQIAIKRGIEVAAAVAAMGKGKVHMVLFDSTPRHMEVTGKSLDEINKLCAHVQADGGTSIGCGLYLMATLGHHIDMIILVTDGWENSSPYFADVYNAMTAQATVKPPVYFCGVVGLRGAADRSLGDSLRRAGIDFTSYDVQSTDYYAITNLVQNFRLQRYSLLQEVMDTPLLTLDGALAR